MMDKKELNAVELETIAGGDDWQVHNDNWFVERHNFQEPSPVVNPHPGSPPPNEYPDPRHKLHPINPDNVVIIGRF